MKEKLNNDRVGSVLCKFTLFTKQDNKLLNTIAFVICEKNVQFILASSFYLAEKELSATCKISRITIFQKVAEGLRDIHLQLLRERDLFWTNSS